MDADYAGLGDFLQVTALIMRLQSELCAFGFVYMLMMRLECCTLQINADSIGCYCV